MRGLEFLFVLWADATVEWWFNDIRNRIRRKETPEYSLLKCVGLEK